MILYLCIRIERTEKKRRKHRKGQNDHDAQQCRRANASVRTSAHTNENTEENLHQR